MSKLKQIRAQCLECVDGQAEVRACAFFACPLWPFRMSRNPFNTKKTEAYCKQFGLPVPVKAGAGVDLDTLRSWAGQNLPMESVVSPDPRDMTLEELAALGCTQSSPARALRHDAGDNDAPYVERIARIAARRGHLVEIAQQIDRLDGREAPKAT